MKKKTIIIGLLLITITLGITYAWWRWQSSTNTNVTFTIEGATITYNGGPDISNIVLIPVSSKEVGETNNTGVAKTITASANKTMYINLNLDLVTFPSALAEESLVWEIYKGNDKLGNGNFDNKQQGDTITLFANETINSTTSTYKLYIWIDGNQENPSTMMNQDFVFHLNANVTDETPPSDLPDFILNSNAPLDSVNSTYVTSHYETYTLSNADKATLKTYMVNEDGYSSSDADDCLADDYCWKWEWQDYNEANDPDLELIGTGNLIPGIDFRYPSSDTNGKGLYIRSGTENNTYPIYYYRGAVDNNNVYFANYCWKIVRTTETGGLKLIYNGTPTNGSCGSTTTSQSNSTIGNSAFNTSCNDAKYVGYTYDNSGVETDSTIKGVIDTWYQTNLLTNFDNYIEDTVYCNDKEEVTVQEKTQIETAQNSAYDKLYKSVARVMNTTPSLTCTNNADKYTKSSSIGNGKLTYPVGLLTMDEIWIAGVGLEKLNGIWANPTSYYLDNGNYWWALSPGGFDSLALVWFAGPDAGLSGDGIVGNGGGARPAISLKPGQNFDYGNGTGANPYRFVVTVPSS